MAPELFCGYKAQAFIISVLCPRAVTAEPMTLTSRIRSLARPQVPPATVRFCGQKPVMSTILVPCREILQARLSQSIRLVMLWDTRGVQEACARFCGRKRLECRISECSQAEIRAALLISTTWAMWLGVLQVLQARTLITRSSGQ